jgi:hypothetical protein
VPDTGPRIGFVEYKEVFRPHVVPRGYLRGFAVGELIGMRLVGEASSKEIPVSKAGVLKNFYVRHRPQDGTPIYDTDWSLDHIDKVAPAILREISERWPLGLLDKLALAEFMAIQMVRGPRWRNWHSDLTSDYFADALVSREFEGSQPEGMTYEEGLADAERQLSSDTATMTKMLEQSRKGAQIFGSMHWTLVEFGRPWLATSDHPVVTWRLGVSSRQPRKSENFVEGGLVNTLEARFPVSARRAMLMTWLDLPDGGASIVSGSKEIAANINAFSVAEAEHQWFHLPGATAPRASGQLLPIAPQLLRGYGAEVALASRRRNVTERRIQPRLGDGHLDAGFEVLTIRADGQIEIVSVAPPAREDHSSDAA